MSVAKSLDNQRRAEQVIGREGETATFLSRFLVSLSLRVIGFAPRQRRRYISFVMSKLIRWETPFTDEQRPSVGLIITTKEEETDILQAIVAPKGIDVYPKYLVTFGEVIAFTCFEEAHAPERDFASAEFVEEKVCAYEYLDSPWLKSYSGWLPIYFGNETDSFYHYLIFGGDNNIEVITPNRPKIEVIEEKTILQMQREI